MLLAKAKYRSLIKPMKNKLTYLVLFLFITTSWAQQDSITKIDVQYNYVVRGMQQNK
jgi:hypothetical protein